MNPVLVFLGRTASAINPLILPFAALCGLVMAAVALSFITHFRARSMVRAAEERARADRSAGEAALDSLRRELTALVGQLNEERIPASAPASSPRPGLNLTTRSQAIRMQRRGENPVSIAAALGVPLQEVDLLLKVHRIVIGKL